MANEDFEVKVNVYAFDSTTIDLCLSVFWWAKFRKAKGGIKIHTLYDITTQIPEFIHITDASVHDANTMDNIPYERGAHYIFNRTYVDYERLFKITQLDTFFVIRCKKNMKFKCRKFNPVDGTIDIMSNQIGVLIGGKARNQYPLKLRKIVFCDAEMNRTFEFLTNNMELTSTQIALLNKSRWKIELIFKWLKQHLKIKSFWGTTENAVRIQIYTAIITYSLFAIAGKDFQLNRPTYEMLRVFGISLLDKTAIKELFSKADMRENQTQNSKQLSIILF